MEILKQIEAKDKAIKIIESCLSLEQLYVAKNYIIRYNIVFEDLLGYHHLNRLILDKENKFK